MLSWAAKPHYNSIARRSGRSTLPHLDFAKAMDSHRKRLFSFAHEENIVRARAFRHARSGSGTVERLRRASSGAFQVASHIAQKSGTRFDSASYTLRTDQHGDPVWIVTLHATNGQPVGTIHIGANRGTVTRTEGMFAGATMEDVQTEREVPRNVREENAQEEGGEERGPFYGVRQRMRPYFRRAQDEANGMFDRV